MKKIAFLFCLMMCAYSFIFAQCAFTLSGRVIDHHDRTPLEFAEVFIPELKKGGLTDSLGYYKITGICNGNYTLVCKHLGCEDVKLPITVNGNTVQNFYPEHHLHELGLVAVVEDKQPIKNTQVSYSLTQRELEQKMGQSLGKLLEAVPGVTVLQTGSGISKPVINGLHSNRILILNNGIRQEGQQWGSEHAPEIDPFIGTNITVVKGANAVKYGSDAIAGVILVEPSKLPDNERISGELNAVSATNGRSGIISGMVEQNFKKLTSLSWRLQGTVKKVGTMHTPRYYLSNSAVEEYNFSATAGWNKKNYGVEVFYSQFNTNIGILSAAHIGNVTDLLDAIARTEPITKGQFTYEVNRPYQHIEHELFKAKVYVFTGNAGKLNITYARQYNLRNEYDKDLPLNDSLAGLNTPELQFEITSNSVDLNWEHKTVKRISGTIGVNGLTQGNTYEGRYFVPNYSNRTGGIYWVERWTKNKLQLELGTRYDYRLLQVFKYHNNALIRPVHTFENVTGTFGAIYKFSDKLSSTINIGSAWRAPAVNELYSDGIHHGTATYEVGNKALIPEKAINTIVGVSYKKHEKFSVELSAHYNSIRNFIYLQPVLTPTVTIHGAFPTFEYKQVNALLTGADVQVNYYIVPQLLVTCKTSLLRAYNKTINDFLIQMPADRGEANLTYNFKSLNNVKDSYLSVSGLYVNKQFRVPANADYALPPEAYFLLGIETGTSFVINKQAFIVGLGVSNLLNTSYRDYMNKFRYYTDEVGRNITLRLKEPMGKVN